MASSSQLLMTVICCIALFSPLLSPPAASSGNQIPILEEAFIQCFHRQAPSVLSEATTQVIYRRGTTPYDALLVSSINNEAFLNSTSKPLLIVSPMHETHVRASVLCGREHGIRLRVRSGGHDYEGLSYRSAQDLPLPFVMLDVARLRSVRTVTSERSAWVEAGATLGELYYDIAKKSKVLGFPGGFFPTVGIGGHIGGGGVGAMVRKYGLAVDNVVDARLVDARGKVLDRSAMGEDMFWAIRGGGAASFGVVLSYKLQLVDVPRKVTVFTATRTANQGGIGLLVKWQYVAPRMVRDLYVAVVMAPTTTAGGEVTIRFSFLCLFLGEKGHLLRLMARDFPELGVAAEDCTEMSWIEAVLYFSVNYQNRPVEALLDRTPQLNISFKGKYDFVEEPISEKSWEGICQWLIQRGQGKAWRLGLDPYGGRMDEISESAVPYPHRKGNIYKVLYLVSWKGGGVAEENREWMRRFYEYMAPHVSKDPRGAYFNVRDLDLGKNEVVGKADYGEGETWGRRYFKGNFERLAVVKGRTDPDNYFWSEQSIPPLLRPVHEGN